MARKSRRPLHFEKGYGSYDVLA